LPAMLALDERDSTARALCVELARVTDGRPMQWRMVRLIGPAVGQDEATADMAIAYSVERGWLIAAGRPPHSIRLTDDGCIPSATLPKRAPLARRSSEPAAGNRAL
jgi:hypothetical protein